MHSKAIPFLLAALWHIALAAQVPSDYFQQAVSYDMDVTLIDTLHELQGTVDITYTNQSPDELDKIYLHLWPNAYKNRQTALAKQLVENGNTRMFYAKMEDLGGYREMDIRLEGKVVQWDYWENHLDVALLYLPQKLASGASLTINTRFTLDIPLGEFSRMGHIGQTYQMTQWYPKPAVYDRQGWHPMPYLDQGEFYSEFGDFEVKITLPENYVVGATGVLQTESEKAFLEEKIKQTQALKESDTFEDTDTIPTSSAQNKTIHYKAKKVHDFAWFADKRFHVDKSQVTLPSGHEVETYTMFTNTQADWWAKAIDYVNRSVEFYSAKVGEYPYPQATAIQAVGSSGQAMEYPMITIIGYAGSEQALDEVITHEIGHNWFMGMLASNERAHAWMDEGINSFYEKKYIQEYYGEPEKSDEYGMFSNLSAHTLNQLSFYIPMRRHSDQPINTTSEELTAHNYWVAAYDKPAYLLKYLEIYIGQDFFHDIMQTYFKEWQFKHPQPEDFRAVLERESGRDLSWFFDDLINTTKPLDYKMKSIKREGDNYLITIQNKGKVAAPFTLDAVQGKEVQSTQWVDGFEGEQTITVEIVSPDKFVIDPDKFVIDANYLMPDLYRQNNSIRPKGGKVEPLEFRFFGGAEDARRTSVYYSPVLAGNSYDGFMLGASFYNTVVPNRRFEWTLAPMYGFRSKAAVGVADAKYHWYPKGGVQRVTLGADYRGFHYNRNNFYKDSLGGDAEFRYDRITPRLEVELKKKRARDKTKHRFTLEVPIIGIERPGNTQERPYRGHDQEWYVLPRLRYSLDHKSTLHPYSITAQVEQLSHERRDYVKLNIEASNRFDYEKGKGLHLRTFVGAFLMDNKREVDSRTVGSLSLFSNGVNDVWYDGLYFGRNENTGFFSGQVNPGLGGGFKFPFRENNSTGVSNIFVAAANFKLDLPMDLPDFFPDIKPYLDMGYYHEDEFSSLNDGFLMDFGVALEVGEMLGFYFPIVQNKNLKDLRPDKYGARVSFRMDLDKIIRGLDINQAGL